MPILRSETDLNASDFASIPNSTGSLSAQITLQRYGPVWAGHPNDTDNGRGGENFDAILVGEYLLRAYGCTVSEVSVDYMPSEVSGLSDASWINVDATAIDDVDATIPVTLVSGTSPLARLFYVDTAGVIKYSECTDIVNNAFGAPVTVRSPFNEVEDIAPTSTTRVHYTTKTSQRNRRFHYAEYNGSWSVVDSDVYWPYPIRGFDAVALDADTDLLVVATDLPPLLGSRIVGTEIQAEVNKVQALVTFEVRNGRWSDWLPVDAIDRVPEDHQKARDDVRLSYHNDLLFATYDRAGGDGDYEYTYPAVTRSASGENWEYPEFIPDADAPFAILPRGDYLYAVGVSGTLRSLRCAWAGQTPVEYDATPYVLGMESQAAEIRNSNVSLANPPDSTTDVFQGVLADYLPLSDDRLQLKYELGYWIDGSARKVHVSTEDVIQRGEQRGLPNLNLALASQDYLGRMNRVRSDYAAEWPGMQCGRDPFTDTTGTGYGGLRHMAPIKPSFKASGGVLNLISNNKEGIAISTFVSDALCGSVQASVDLVYDDQGERQGLTLRTFDKDNLYYCAYYPDDNVFKLYKRTGVVDGDADFTDTLLATSDAIASWAGTETDKHWMKVLVRYNQFTLYRSDDGKTWTTVTWSGAGFVELPGHESTSKVVWSGRFGVIGYGYSDVDVPPTWPDIPWPPPRIPPDNHGVAVLCEDQAAVSFDFFDSVVPTWYNLDPNDDLIDPYGGGSFTGAFLSIAINHDNKAIITTLDDTDDYINWDKTGLFYCDDISKAIDGTIEWTFLKSAEDAHTETGITTAAKVPFGATYTHGDSTMGAVLHGGPPILGANPASVLYLVSPDGTLSYYVLPVDTYPFYCPVPRDGTTHALWADVGDWYICGASHLGPGGFIIHGTGGSWTWINFTATEPTRLQSAAGGYVGGHTGYVYADWDPSQRIGSVVAATNLGVQTGDTAHYIYLDAAADAFNDLWQDAVLIGDATSPITGFGAGCDGGHAEFKKKSDTTIVWVCGNTAAFADRRVVIYTPNNGMNWINKTGNLQAALGGPTDWSGGYRNALSMARPFRHSVST